MTLEQIRNSDAAVLTAEEIAPLLRTHPQALRILAREHPERLGFPSIQTTEHKVVFPRIPFLRFIGIDETKGG